MSVSRVDPVGTLAPDATRADARALAVEAPVAIEVNGIGYAVMMATPADLAPFATGFMLTERLADIAAEVIDVDPFETPEGWIVRVTLAEQRAGRIGDRVRHRTSDTGCGLCGVSGLEQVRRPVPRPAPRTRVARAALFASLDAIRDHQPLNRATGAAHAAAWCDGEGRVARAFEDVGRHNALDKLIGWLALEGADAASGFVLVTSRLSFEMVDKTLIAGAGLLVGISAHTTMAADHARAHELTMVALARGDAMLVVNDPGEVFG